MNNFGTNRIKLLNQAIETEYGHLATDEVEILASQYEHATFDMIEAARVGKSRCRFINPKRLERDFPVIVPENISRFMERGDPFWAAIGYDADGIRNLLYLSPQYLSEEAFKWNSSASTDSIAEPE